jgi:hypothetical protein
MGIDLENWPPNLYIFRPFARVSGPFQALHNRPRWLYVQKPTVQRRCIRLILHAALKKVSLPSHQVTDRGIE